MTDLRELEKRLATDAGLSSRFWKKVARGGAAECWLWQGAKSPRGYGTYRATKRVAVRAHR